MSQSLVYILLLFALALPILGAVMLRALGSRITLAQLYVVAAGLFGLALVSVFLLARGDVPSLQVGGLSVLLPVVVPEDSTASIPVPAAEPPTSLPPASPPAATEVTATSAVTATAAAAAPTAAPTTAATEAPTAAPTEAPTTAATQAPAAAATEAPTAPPTPAPTAPPQPPQPRKYTVQSGDTLRSIAEKFNVSVTAIVEANKLTPAQADSLRVGQELTIP